MTSARTARPRRRRRARTPVVLQMEAAECGAAALGIVLGYFGRHVPLEELRRECDVTRDGSNAGNMLKAAVRYGLEGHGYKKEAAGLPALPMPAVVFWEFDHFVVVEGFGRGRVFLNDPSAGRRTVTAAEFDGSYAGVVLTFTPTAAFRRGGRPPRVWRGLAGRAAGTRGAVAFLFLAGLGLVVPGLVAPAASRVFVDDVLVGGRSGWLRPLLLAVGLTALTQAGLLALQTHYLIRLQARLTLAGSCRFFWRLLCLPAEFFQQRSAGDVGGRVASHSRIAGMLSGGLTGSLVNLTLIAVYAAVMARTDAVLAAVGLAAAVLNLAALWWASATLSAGHQRLAKETGRLTAATMAGLRAIETVKAGGAERDLFARWAGHQAGVNNASQELGVAASSLGTLPAFLAAACNTAVLGLGGLRVIDGDLTLGTVVAFQGLMGVFLQPVGQLTAFGTSLRGVQADVTRLDDVEAYGRDAAAPPPAAEPAGPAAGPLAGRVELVDVTYGYGRLAPPLIQGFHLAVAPGRRVALVGGTGSGKSTVARIVAGLLTPWSGEVRFDGRPRGDWPRRRLAGAVAVVDQDVMLFAGTVRDNLTLWDPAVPDADLVRAARDAGVHDDIMARPGGYDGAVEEGGGNFSGGQRQRLEIARALATNPAVLVLDEATSALDPLTEARVDDALRRRGCTCLLVAHRLSTIRDCDEIVVLDRGRVAERGTHDELMRADGPYRRLIRAE